jgi:predicted ribosome quality control (RQC) complex YloA/Tae2 family protein
MANPAIKETFNLKSAIEGFKTKYVQEGKVKDPASREMIESLMNIQRDAVEAAIKDISALDSLTDMIYGKAAEPAKPNGHDRSQEVSQDILNRTLRELEATENLAVHFKTELEKLKEDLKKSKQETEAYERVSEAYDKVAVSIYEELQETVSRLSMVRNWFKYWE